MGKYFVSSNHIEELMTKFTKDQHLLCRTYLESKTFSYSNISNPPSNIKYTPCASNDGLSIKKYTFILDTDKMHYEAVNKLSSPNVLKLLQNITDTVMQQDNI